MNLRTTLLAAVLLVCTLALSACGGTPPATLADIPVFPGATELPSNSTLAQTLQQNNQTDAAMRGQLGVGGSTAQQGFSLPPAADWTAVRSFYDERLKAAGWSENSMMNGILEQANQGNSAFQMANWQRDKQNVSIVMLTMPDSGEKGVMVSLSTQ